MQNRVTHGRRIKTIFVFLAAMILVAHLSSVLLLNRVIVEEEQKVQSRLRNAVNGVLRVWTGGGVPFEAVDSVVAPLLRSGVVAAVWIADNQTGTSWRVRRFGKVDILAPVLGAPESPGRSPWQYRVTAPFSNAEYEDAGQLHRTYSMAGSIGETPIIVGAAIPSPTTGQLRTIWHWDFYLRGVVLILFVWFSIQFFRLIFIPYQKMRAQAAQLSGTGLLPGPESDDVEYVMAAFASAVERLHRQKDNLQIRYDRRQRQYENLEKFNTYILNSMSAGVLILNRQGTVLRLNPSARQILGLGSAEISGQSYAELQNRFPELGAVLSAGLQDSRAYQRREITINLDADRGDKRFLGITTSLIHDEEDRVVGISVLLTDLTEIKRLQADLENNRRLADLGEMAAGLAHQLRNSLAAIVGFGKLLRRKISPDDPAGGTIDDVLQEAAESEQMLERFLNFARPIDLAFQPSSLTEIIERAEDMVRASLAERKITLVVQKPPGDDCLEADPLLLRQVFVNLLANAADAMAEGGRIDVRILSPVAVDDDGGHWIIRVGDTGPGIPGTDHEKIFQPFYTAKETGTGLGLAIARKIVSCHGGYLSVESSTPSGTVFLLRLPQKANSLSRRGIDDHSTPVPPAKVSERG